MKILHLTLKKKWFDMIASGEKKEEYREVKPYWRKRLNDKNDNYREFDIVRFKNGYQKNAPFVDVELRGINLANTGKQEWGAEPFQVYYILSLGKILNTQNL